MILALDIAGKTGYCRNTSTEGLVYGTWDFSRKGKYSKSWQLQNFYWRLDDLAYRGELDPEYDFIAYEKPGGRFFSGVRSHANFEGVLLLFCEQKGIEYKGYSATQIKKFIAGKGNASKKDVKKAVEELKYSPEDYDQADAIALYFLALNERNESLRISEGTEAQLQSSS